MSPVRTTSPKRSWTTGHSTAYAAPVGEHRRGIIRGPELHDFEAPAFVRPGRGGLSLVGEVRLADPNQEQGRAGPTIARPGVATFRPAEFVALDRRRRAQTPS